MHELRALRAYPERRCPSGLPALAGSRDAGEKHPCIPCTKGYCAYTIVKGSLRRHPHPVPSLRYGLRLAVSPLTMATADNEQDNFSVFGNLA